MEFDCVTCPLMACEACLVTYEERTDDSNDYLCTCGKFSESKTAKNKTVDI